MSRYIEVSECRTCEKALRIDPGVSVCELTDLLCPSTGIARWCPLPVLPPVADVSEELLRREEESDEKA